MENIAQHVIDRASEWVSENYPELEGGEFDKAVEKAAKEIAAIDAANDRAEALGVPAYHHKVGF